MRSYFLQYVSEIVGQSDKESSCLLDTVQNFV